MENALRLAPPGYGFEVRIKPFPYSQYTPQHFVISCLIEAKPFSLSIASMSSPSLSETLKVQEADDSGCHDTSPQRNALLDTESESDYENSTLGKCLHVCSVLHCSMLILIKFILEVHSGCWICCYDMSIVVSLAAGDAHHDPSVASRIKRAAEGSPETNSSSKMPRV